jgi:hypothetical protein
MLSSILGLMLSSIVRAVMLYPPPPPEIKAGKGLLKGFLATFVAYLRGRIFSKSIWTFHPTYPLPKAAGFFCF